MYITLIACLSKIMLMNLKGDICKNIRRMGMSSPHKLPWADPLVT